jgi:hypothetical protein
MEHLLNSNLYKQFKNDISHILNFKNKQELADKICLLSWEVSFISKEARINKILDFIKKEKLDKITDNHRKIDILELILALSHLRRAIYIHRHSIGMDKKS